MRINKFIAKCGVASRREADRLIEAGRVEVNGRILTELGYQVERNDLVLVGGKEISLVDEKIYIMLNKPKGYTCTNNDPFADRTIFDLIDLDYKLFSIGRLDKDSRGLILITNDGDLYNRIMHPKNQVFKTYEVLLNKEFNKGLESNFRRGIDIGDYVTQPSYLTFMDNPRMITIKISEGKKRQIRRMFHALGYYVKDLKRTSIAELDLANLKEGQYRYLTKKEVSYLYSI